MFSCSKPTDSVISRFLDDRANDSFSYPEVGATRTGAPPGYNIDHSRVLLGYGHNTFMSATQALARWETFNIGWVRLIHPDTPIAVGMNVAILAHTLGMYSLSSSRVVYLLDEVIPIRRWGFGYGTLTHHVERGEERFSIEWLAQDDSVWYDILAFSNPKHPLAQIGYFASRHYQRRFARDSKAAMLRATSSKSDEDKPITASLEA